MSCRVSLSRRHRVVYFSLSTLQCLYLCIECNRGRCKCLHTMNVGPPLKLAHPPHGHVCRLRAVSFSGRLVSVWVHPALMCVFVFWCFVFLFAPGARRFRGSLIGSLALPRFRYLPGGRAAAENGFLRCCLWTCFVFFLHPGPEDSKEPVLQGTTLGT